jgi:hypothetical protein
MSDIKDILKRAGEESTASIADFGNDQLLKKASTPPKKRKEDINTPIWVTSFVAIVDPSTLQKLTLVVTVSDQYSLCGEWLGKFIVFI